MTMLSLNIDDIQLRRETLDWQNKHMLLIEKHFSKELPNLFRKINNQIYRISNDNQGFCEYFSRVVCSSLNSISLVYIGGLPAVDSDILGSLAIITEL